MKCPRNLTGLTGRVLAIAVSTAVVVSPEPLAATRQGADAMVVAAGVVVLASAGYDIATAPASARAHNAS